MFMNGKKRTESNWKRGRVPIFKMTTEIFHSMGHPTHAGEEKKFELDIPAHAVNTYRPLNEDYPLN